MRKLALGLAAAAAITLAAVPAMAQVGVYAGPGGIGVQLGAPYYDGYYPYDGYYDYVGSGWEWGGHPGWHRHHFHRHYYR